MNLKRELTVRPEPNALGFPGQPFKVYKEDSKGIVTRIPRFFDKTFKQEFSRGEPALIKCTTKLRDYQSEALKKFSGNGVLCLPCGYGKTVCAIAMAAKLQRKTLIIVHKEFLADQWIERINQYAPGSSIGRIQGDLFDTDGHSFVIAMIQTLCSRDFTDRLSGFGFLIVDEAHHIGAPAFSQVMFMVRTEYTLGLSATPERKDGLTRLLHWFLGPVFYKKVQEAQELRVEKVDFRGPFPDVSINKLGKICMATMVTDLTLINERNDVLLKILRDLVARDRVVLFLSDRRSHCEYVTSEIPGSTLYIGGMKLGPFKNLIVSTFSLAYEGLDIPELDTLVLGTPHSDITQALGRIMRRPGPKEVWDLVDHWSIFDSMWYKRRDIYFPKKVQCVL